MKRTALLLFLAFAVVCLAQAPRPPVDKLSQLTDVHLTSPTNTQVLTYDSGTSKWINAAGGGGGTSLFTALDFTNSQTIPMYLKAPLHLHSTGDSTNPAAHPYTMLTTGIYVTDANNAEVFRLWASDPDVTDNFNSGNLYIGALAGESQPSDNTSAGYNNTGVGYHALKAITTGTVNSVLGSLALEKNTTGSANTVFGEGSLQENTDGSGNTAIGYNSDPGFHQHLNNTVLIGANAAAGSESLTNAIAIGSTASVASSNTAVIGNGSVTDVYFGSTSGSATLHGTMAGFVPTTRTLTIGPDTFDLSTNRTFLANVSNVLQAPATRNLTIGPTTQDLSVDRTFLSNVTNDTQAKASTTLSVGPDTGDLSANRIFLVNVTNDVQTKASVLPNTAPGIGQIPIGNSTAYAPKTLSGSGVTASLNDLGVLTLSAIPNSTLSNSTITIGGTSTALGGSVLGNVTNDTQTKAAIVPNTAPSAGQLLVGNAGGTAYAPVTLSGSGATATLSSAGILTLSSIAIASLATSTSTAIGVGSIELGNASDTTITRSGAGAIQVEGAQVLLSGAALGTPSSGTLTNCTFPTLNQNTTGSAASLSISGQTGLMTVTGLTSTNRIKTVRDAADTILELGGSYTPTGTWTSLTMVTPVLGTPTSGTLTNCTGLPVAGITSSTSTALGVGSLELGNASDTTLSRSSGGVLAVEGVKVLATNSTSGTGSGIVTVNSTSGAIVAGKTTSGGTSSSGTPGTNVATITAGAGNQFICINGLGSCASAANTQILCTITYSDSTTTTDTTAAGTNSCQFVNDEGISRQVTGVLTTHVAHSAKKITAIAFTTAGTGTSARFASVSALEIPQ